MITAFDPLVVRVSIQSSADHGRSFDLLINGAVAMAGESFAVVDSVREALYGHRAGVAGELLEIADAILSRWCEGCGVYGMTRAMCPRDVCGGPVQPALPGDVGAVRGVENPSPALAPEPEFSLRAEVARVVPVNRSLF